MKSEFVGSCTGQIKLLSMIVVFSIIPSSVFQQEISEKESSDSSQTEWNLPFGIMKPSPAQHIQLRALQNPFRINTEMTFENRAATSHQFIDFSQMFHDWDNSHLSYPGIEYRHGSNYIPQNVRDYTEFKMGRDRYLPIFNPVLIGFILYNVSQYASYYFGEKDTRSLFEKLNRRQKQILLVLHDNYPLNQDVWYSLYQNTFPDSSISKTSFINEINELDKLSLVKTRTFEEKEIRYYPAIKGGSRQSQEEIK
ncbi:MAG: hypothetical protein GQ561_06540 [Calditrichae bacterium]|nr:hypothetical protein [Calditrichia bacterium]